MQDIQDCQKPDGAIPLIVPASKWGWDHTPVWTSVYVLVPWYFICIMGIAMYWISVNAKPPISFRLHFGLTPSEDKNQVILHLLHDIITVRDKHLNTGIIGTKYILPVLTDLGFSNYCRRIKKTLAPLPALILIHKPNLHRYSYPHGIR